MQQSASHYNTLQNTYICMCFGSNKIHFSMLYSSCHVLCCLYFEWGRNPPRLEMAAACGHTTTEPIFSYAWTPANGQLPTRTHIGFSSFSLSLSHMPCMHRKTLQVNLHVRTFNHTHWGCVLMCVCARRTENTPKKQFTART